MKKAAILLVLVLISTIVVFYLMIQDRGQTIGKLNSLAAAGKASTPIMVDDITSLDSVEASGMKLVFSYTIFENPQNMDVNDLEKSVKSFFVTSACSVEDINSLLSEGVSFQYRYKFGNGIDAGNFMYTKQDCS